MDLHIVIVLAILAATVILLAFEIVRIDVAALCCMLALGWTGILTPVEMFSGFSSHAVIAMMAVMIMGRGITRTGIMDRFSDFVIKKAGKGRKKLTAILSVAIGLSSGFIQNIGAAALFLPGVMQVSRRARIPVSSLVMPVGFAAILGGTLTMVGSGPLILVNDLLKNAGLKAYHLFSVTPVGVILLLSGIVFFIVLGRRILPEKEVSGAFRSEQEKLVEKLNLPHNFKLLMVTGESPLAGRTTEQSGVWDRYHIHILGIGKGREVIYAPWRETVFEEGHTLAILGSWENIETFSKDHRLSDKISGRFFSDEFNPYRSGFAEVIVPPDSELAGKSIREYSLRKRFAVEPVLLFSRGEKVDGDFSDVVIAPGDSIIIYGRWEKIIDLKKTTDLIVVTRIEGEKKDASRLLPAMGCFAFAVILAVTGFPIAMSFMTGAVCMVLAKVLNIGEAYRAVEWKVVFLLAGLIPLGIAMEKTGAASFLAESLMTQAADMHPLIFITIVAVLSTAFSLFMSNVGAVVVLVPLVMNMAEIAGIDPRPVVLLAAVCAANSFVLPTHQVNALLMSSGGYRTSDYIKAGGGMTLVFLIAAVGLFYFFII